MNGPKGFRLPGMVSFDKNASSGLQPTDRLNKLLKEMGPVLGAAKVTVSEKGIDGEKMFHNARIKRTFLEKLNALNRHISEEEPTIFVLYRDDKDVLMVTFVPENIKPKKKMLYASSKSALKSAIEKADEGCLIEEYNTTEADELSSKRYQKHKNVEAPLTEYEIEKLEMDQMETAGGYGFLAQLQKAQGSKFQLPGVNLKKTQATAKKEDDDDNDDDDDDNASDSD
uniref:ADF-H domain-containing protein n=1 Tax=Aplanochytrium stocchinoi TaxID=215587 RepID=A0A7S3PCX5_9STRA|mmetsp:Transcript_5864/g.7392  ORF Transcript_5864/g.7392 Transcript_5864/m.7392 type:complete len:227 (-) Transcript_5864:380-1060(-)|eukprot:CAMPEP_0204830028 /NCGR_PEP_ID=MMETSP1346-20131115/8290_1 /ASSEMBLY_ACC=CAM_ASM_000771 /TAXON_ID=215587 /ORGANISM="Aplanochytrium stocchinoi, Strain GSBS06" /LENGTH=226 /DNA_ID=CAMNT_0051960147 /DNA_START=143 /DNA_END=823 /DNA_ORIENTATION=+